MQVLNWVHKICKRSEKQDSKQHHSSESIEKRKTSITEILWSKFSSLVQDPISVQFSFSKRRKVSRTGKLTFSQSLDHLTFSTASYENPSIATTALRTVEEVIGGTSLALTYTSNEDDYSVQVVILKVQSAEIRSLLIYGLFRLISRRTIDVNVEHQGAAKKSKCKDVHASLNACIRRFNVNAKKGIDDALHLGFIEDNQASEIASFLRYTFGLDKIKIGEYLGSNTEMAINVLHSFAQCRSLF